MLDQLNTKYEIIADAYVAKCLAFMAGVSVFSWLLGVMGVFTVNIVLLHIGLGIGFVFMSIPWVIENYVKGYSPWKKYVYILFCLIGLSAISAALTYNAVLIWALPLVLAGHYRSKNFIYLATTISIIFMTVSFIVGTYWGSWDSNLMNALPMVGDRFITLDTIHDALSLFILPRILILLGVSAICSTLADKANNMISDQKTLSTEKERIGAELDIATKIQQSMLPSIFPAFPEKKEFDIYAVMQPAKEVGGDFYDFFLINENKMAVVIADVSGKGVPAALFMVITKTLIKNYASMGLSPSEVFTKVNNLLCEGNDASMFVTAFMGYLDIDTGYFCYVNAGHNRPCVMRSGDNFEFLQVPAGFILAGMENTNFKENCMRLNAGDTLFMYTDGVTEATNNSDELFSDARLLDVLNKNIKKCPKELLEKVSEEINIFVEDAPQFDDITMLAVKLSDVLPSLDLTIPAKIENLDTVIDFITKELEKSDCPVKITIPITVAVEEIFVNIANYAYRPHTGDATIKCVAKSNSVLIEFSDDGNPFNPLENPDPDTTADAQDREIGGLGIFMVKKSMDTVSYEYKNGKNILIIVKNW